jgi:IMP cyclohydrolase
MELQTIRLATVTLLFGTLLATASMAQQSAAPSQGLAQQHLVTSFEHQVTGVTVSKDGRIFVNFPR